MEWLLNTTKQMKHKWEEVGVNVCDRTVRNRLKEMGFQYRKAKRKPALTPKHKRTRLQWAKESLAKVPTVLGSNYNHETLCILLGFTDE
uniref:Transposase Tc1-like domain-containing protein n=1 Tax=Xiphophorus maculatus TaxID=8083 RepID=A0A3B5PQ58_XIPMA